MATRTRLQVAADLMQQGRLADARARLLKELRLDPKSGPALQLLGAVLFQMGRREEAIEHLRRAARLMPSSPAPILNLGKALLEAGHTQEAADTLAEAARHWPDVAEGRLSYGNALYALRRLEHAAAEYRAAIALAPRQPGLYANLALALYSLRDYEAVCSTCEQLLALEPRSVEGRLLLAMSRQRLCAWEGYDDSLASAAEIVRSGRSVRGMAHASMLLWDDPDLHRRCAELGAAYYAPRGAPPPPKFPARTGDRIRIAYVSPDLRQHPVTTLIASLIETHCRERFEVIAISLGADDGSAERQRLAKAFDRFLDMSDMPTDAIVRAAREMELDIAVDLAGYTGECRPRLFMERIAPVQAAYLGFPGTTAIAAMDYLVVDPFVAAGGIRHSASEKLAILPDCLLCSDRLGQPPEIPSRASCGLPEDAFVFCSFNERKKLTPQVFGRWMRIMAQVEGSVLWLPRPPAAVEGRLRGEAERHGVAAERIIFAERVASLAEHIARNGVPDLHLDTYPYNAHTTASDALRAGCPILTLAGACYPARVCGSLLSTIGVPELITGSAEEYEAMAVRLARDKDLLAGLRRRIEAGRTQSPLFETERFCRNIERAYAAMAERSRAGKPPAEIDVRSLPG